MPRVNDKTKFKENVLDKKEKESSELETKELSEMVNDAQMGILEIFLSRLENAESEIVTLKSKVQTLEGGA